MRERVTKVFKMTHNGESWWEVRWQTWYGGWKTQTTSNGKLGSRPVIYHSKEAAVTEAQRISSMSVIIEEEEWCSHQKEEK